jgi:hypothetical protein
MPLERMLRLRVPVPRGPANESPPRMHVRCFDDTSGTERPRLQTNSA